MPAVELGADERRRRHDTERRLAVEEGQLSTVRTSYSASIGTALLTALFVAIADLPAESTLLVGAANFLAHSRLCPDERAVS